MSDDPLAWKGEKTRSQQEIASMLATGDSALGELSGEKKKGGIGKWLMIGCGCMTLIALIVGGLMWFTWSKAGPMIKAGSQLGVTAEAIKQYARDHDGQYPQSLQEVLDSQVFQDAPAMFRHDGIDPWGNPYIYTPPDEGDDNWELKTYGADGVEGGEDMNQDLIFNNSGPVQPR